MADLRDPNTAVDFIIANAGKFAAAKSRRVFLDGYRNSLKALLMRQSSSKASVEREEYAYAHEDYLSLVYDLKAAIEEEERLFWELTAAQLRVDMWRTQQGLHKEESHG